MEAIRETYPTAVDRVSNIISALYFSSHGFVWTALCVTLPPNRLCPSNSTSTPTASWQKSQHDGRGQSATPLRRSRYLEQEPSRSPHNSQCPRVVRPWPSLHQLYAEYRLPLLSQPQYSSLRGGRLIRRAFTLHELPSLVEAIFLNEDEGDTIRSLLGDDAQAFIDVIDEACSVSARHPEAV